jgi:hypothetical protein
MDCKYCTCCKYYSKDKGACHDDGEALSYCASRSQFEEHAKGNRDIGTNIGNMLIIRIPSIDHKNDNYRYLQHAA